MIRVFPSKTALTPTDSLAFVGDPPFDRPLPMPVRVSVVFTWDIPEGERLVRSWSRFYSDVQIGGPAFGDPGGDFVPGRFVAEGVTVTSRGCPRNCSFCSVWRREGRKVRELPIKPGWLIQDNNLLACSRGHVEAVGEMLAGQSKSANFKGGLDARLIRPWHREYFDSLRISEMWFACDTPAALPALRFTANILSDIPARKKRCYVLLGHGSEPIEQAAARCAEVYALGFWPFAQLFQGEKPVEYGKAWRYLQRYWSRPAIYKAAPCGDDMPLFGVL